MLKEVQAKACIPFLSKVLILILMEHAQRGENTFLSFCSKHGLNPYFNGTCSKSTQLLPLRGLAFILSLNPYFNGTCSKSLRGLAFILNNHGLSLNPYFNGTCSKSITIFIVINHKITVLILILMEHAQRVDTLN